MFRPALRPGAVVLRRDASHLQVGTSPGVVVADRPGLHELLLSLDGAHDVASLARSCPAVVDLQRLLDELVACGVVVDGSRWDPRHLDEARAHGPSFSIDRRLALRVAIHHDSGTAPFTRVLREVLASTGVGQLDASDPDLLVVVSAGEPSRDVFAAAGRGRIPYLSARLDEDKVVLGPFVVPGLSPCVGCDDLDRIDWDPAWAALLPQLGTRRTRHNPPATGALLLHAAAVELAATVVAAADGTAIPLVGRVRTLGPHLHERFDRPVRFHPRCACALLPAA